MSCKDIYYWKNERIFGIKRKLFFSILKGIKKEGFAFYKQIPRIRKPYRWM